jgi:hypothetical protein
MACSNSAAAAGVAFTGTLPVLVFRKSAPASSAISHGGQQRGGAVQRAVGDHDVDLVAAGLDDLARVAHGALDVAAAVGEVGHRGHRDAGRQRGPRLRHEARPDAHRRGGPAAGRADGLAAQRVDVGRRVAVVQAGQVQAGQRGARGGLQFGVGAHLVTSSARRRPGRSRRP